MGPKRYPPELGLVFKKLLDFNLISQDSVHFEPGCGRAHIGAFLARAGFKAVSEDLNEIAVKEAKNFMEI